MIRKQVTALGKQPDGMMGQHGWYNAVIHIGDDSLIDYDGRFAGEHLEGVHAKVATAWFNLPQGKRMKVSPAVGLHIEFSITRGKVKLRRFLRTKGQV